MIRITVDDKTNVIMEKCIIMIKKAYKPKIQHCLHCYLSIKNALVYVLFAPRAASLPLTNKKGVEVVLHFE